MIAFEISFTCAILIMILFEPTFSFIIKLYFSY